MKAKTKSGYRRAVRKLAGLFEDRWLNLAALLALAAFVGALFYIITKWTPLAGDDWGYALNGMSENPFTMAWQFYNSWSGRFFSELWGFVVAPRKWLWNILNPFLFVIIFIFSTLLSARRKSVGVSGLIILMLMLRVSGYLRMETYTWIMGTTYVVPLMMALVYIYVVEKRIIYKKAIRLDWSIVLTSFLCFYIGLAMENIAVVMIMMEIMFLIYYYYYQRKVNIHLSINLGFSLISFILLRLSPGSAYRLITDHYEWNQQSLVAKMLGAMPDFIQYTFIENKYVLFLLCAFLMALIIKRIIDKPKTRTIIMGAVGIIYLATVIGVLATTNLIASLGWNFMEVFLDTANVAIWLFWLAFVVAVIAMVVILVDDIRARQKILFFILIGGAANFVMLASPIFGSRSSLYFVYFMMIAVTLLYQELDISDGLAMLAFSAVMAVLVLRSTQEYIEKYREVNAVQQERLSIIQYYIDNPDIKEVHIPRMPPYSIHGADIEAGDTYHFEVFKEYFGLAEDTTIIFEWKDSY